MQRLSRGQPGCRSGNRQHYRLGMPVVAVLPLLPAKVVDDHLFLPDRLRHPLLAVAIVEVERRRCAWATVGGVTKGSTIPRRHRTGAVPRPRLLDGQDGAVFVAT